MRRAILWILLVCSALLLSACSSEPVDPETWDLSCYYLQSERSFGRNEGVLGSEVQSLSQPLEEWKQILNGYLAGPSRADLASPFPEGLQCVETSLDDGVLTMVLNEPWEQLGGMSETLATACLTRTAMQLPGVKGICLETETNAAAGESAAVLTGQEFLYLDGSTANTATTVRLYFSDANGRYLVSSEREETFASAEEIPTYVVQQLLAGPTEAGQVATMPEGTVLRNLSVEDGCCTVDLSAEFLYNKPTAGLMERMTVLSLVNSLTELDTIRTVRILVEGAPVGLYYTMDLDRELVRDETAMDVVRQGLNETDATLYVWGGSDILLSPVPVSVRQLAQIPIEQTLLEKLTAFSDRNGLKNPLPPGTTLQWVDVHDGYCQADFSSALLHCAGDGTAERMAIRSIVETLLSLDPVRRVKITVNGESDGFSVYTLDRFYTADNLP